MGYLIVLQFTGNTDLVYPVVINCFWMASRINPFQKTVCVFTCKCRHDVVDVTGDLVSSINWGF